jgi:hypothetical protein
MTNYEGEWTGGTGGNFAISDLWAILYALHFNLQSLMLYGTYLNDLVAKGRAGDDVALLTAIKIDPSVITSPSAARRLSFAIAQEDRLFLGQINKAMAGKTGNQRAYLTRFRVVMVALREHGALALPTRELEELVFELGLYSNRPGAQKNVRELIRKTLKRHAISK